MIRAVSWISCFLAGFSISLLLTASLFGQSVQFDCPAIAKASSLTHAGQQVIEIAVPISTTISEQKLEVMEVRMDVFWNRNAYPIVDFGPKTALQSKYDGPVSVEKKKETRFGLGAKVSTSYVEFLTPSLEANANRKNSETIRYNEIPQHDLLLASGTIKRGTGAYFQFKRSPAETLEGSRDLIVAFEVPMSWRGGVLQINCKATGKRRKFGAFKEDFEFARAFVLPIYLEGDDQARQIARQFARSEQRLRQGWSLYQTNEANDIASQFQKLFSSSPGDAPSMWMHHLIQSGSDIAIVRYESALPDKVASAANQFVKARRDLLELSR